ncbi:MAG: hypothetical protein HY744_02035 [Deltaproteobacteria bacterium]|nr:hypothetical protein [Deltaproteobacteria bacterium]
MEHKWRTALLSLVAALLAVVAGCSCQDERAPAGPADAGAQAGGAGAGGGGGGQPDAGPSRAARALILDGELKHFSSWIDVIDALGEAGLAVEYRRFYPHLTAADVDPSGDEHPYEMVVLAAGRYPGNPASRSRFDEIEPAVRFAQQGGALVLVPQHGWQDSYSGENDFFIHNRILERLAVPMRIERNTLIGQAWTSEPPPPHEPTEWGYPTPLEFMLGYPYLLTPEGERIAGGAGPTLRVASPEVQVLLRSYDKGKLWQKLQGAGSIKTLKESRAVGALGRAGEGYAAVVPRGALLLSAATGNLSDKPAMDPEREQVGRDWVRALAAKLHALVRGKADFEVTQAHEGDTMFSVAAQNEEPLAPEGEVVEIASKVVTLPVPEAPPAGKIVEPVPAPPEKPRPAVPWFSPGGGRLAYGSPPPDPSLWPAAFAEIAAHGIDVLMTNTAPSLLTTLSGAELDAERTKYATIAAAADAAGARWFVGDWINYDNKDGKYPSMVGAHGGAAGVPAALSEAHWTEKIIPIYEAVGELAQTTPGLGGLHLDLELYSGPIWHHDGWAFDDDTLSYYLKALADPELAHQLQDAKAAGRLDLLVDAGVLGDFFAALEQEAHDKGARCRKAARAHAPDLELMVYAPGFPNTWFYQGLLRGLGTLDKPVIVLSYDAWARRPTEALYAANVSLVHLGGTIVSHWLPEHFRQVLVSLAQGNDGYWYFMFNDFSATNAQPPALHGKSAEYWAAVDAANAELE